jgi:predicted MFS family arabinose efflux permease
MQAQPDTTATAGPRLAAAAGLPAPAHAAPALGGRRAWLVWGLGAGIYLVAMFHRMALGVAGGDVARHLSIAEGSLGVFVSAQLLTYLLMQVPAGLAADRIGPRRTLAAGLACMAAGEVVFALASGMAVGIVGRVLVGVGDALTFINVIRLAQTWFPASRQAMLVALTGAAGALGQLVSTVPLEAALTHAGLTTTFLAAAAFTAVLVLLPLAAVRDHPPGVAAPETHAHAAIVPTLRAAWARPGTRHGFYVHMTLMAPFAIATAVWGVPFLEHAEGLSHAAAARHELLCVIGFIAGGPVAGAIAGRGRAGQSGVTLALGTLQVAAWLVLLAWPGTVLPEPVLVVALLALGIASGGAMVAFDIARSEAPPIAAGSAAALVNCGGFAAAAAGAAVVGALIGSGSADAGHYARAMLPVLAIAVVGLLQCARFTRLRARG